MAIVLSARYCCRLLRERPLSPLHLLGPVLLGYCQPQLTSRSSVIVLQPPLLCEGWGVRPLCLSEDSSELMDLHWPCDCTGQSSSVFTGPVSLVLLTHFSERSWIVVPFPCFTVVKSFTSLYVLLMLFFLRISSVSPHCSPIKFPFFMHLFMLLFTSLFFSFFSNSSGSIFFLCLHLV